MKKLILCICCMLLFLTVSAYAYEIVPKENAGVPTYYYDTGKGFATKRDNTLFLTYDGIRLKEITLENPVLTTFYEGYQIKPEYLFYLNGYYTYLPLDQNSGVPNNHYYDDNIIISAYDEDFNVIAKTQLYGRIRGYNIKDNKLYFYTQQKTWIVPAMNTASDSASSFLYLMYISSDLQNYEKLEIVNSPFGAKIMDTVEPKVATEAFVSLSSDSVATVEQKRYANVKQRIVLAEDGTTVSERYVSHDDVYYQKLPDEMFTNLYVTEDMPKYLNIWYHDGYYYVEGETEYRRVPAKSANAPYVQVDNTVLGFADLPVLENGQVLTTVDFLAEKLGVTALFDADTQTVTVQNEQNTVSITMGNWLAKVNGAEQPIGVQGRLIDGKPYVPVRFLAESLGYAVEWNAETHTEQIDTSKPAILSMPTDISCTINGKWVQSYAINGNQYIPIKYLSDYGFNLKKIGVSTIIERNGETDFSGNTENFGKTPVRKSVSESLYPVLVKGKIANTYTIDGETVIQADELLVFGSANYNPETRCFEITIE